MKNLKNRKRLILTISLMAIIFVSAGITIPLVLKFSSADQKPMKIKNDREVINKNIELFVNFDQKLTGKPQLPRNQEISKNALEKLAGHKKLPRIVDSVKRRFEIRGNSIDGSALIEVSFEKNEHKGKTSYRISGFENIRDRKARMNRQWIADNKRSFANFNQQLNGEPPLPQNGPILKSDLERLNGHDKLPVVTKSVKRFFWIIGNGAEGTATVRVTFKKGNLTETETWKISGFKQVPKNELEFIDDSDLPFPNDRLGYANNKVKPSPGIIKPAGIKYEFTRWLPNNYEGTIAWEVRLTKAGNSRILAGVLTGFEEKDFLSPELRAHKLKIRNAITQEFAKITRHADEGLAVRNWQELVDFKDDALLKNQALNKQMSYLEHKETIQKIQELGLAYRNKMLSDFKAKMRHGSNNYRSAVLDDDFTIPEGIATIPTNAFAFATFPIGFRLPSSIKKIESIAFYEAKFKSAITLASGVGVDTLAFEEATIPLNFQIEEGVTLAPNSFRDIKIGYFHRWKDQEGNYLTTREPRPGSSLTKPDEEEITFLLVGEFKDQKLPASFRIPDGVTVIREAAFWGATLPSGFRIPQGVTRIEHSALRSLVLPEGFTLKDNGKLNEIGTNAFAYVDLPNSFELPTSIRNIGVRAFWYARINTRFQLPTKGVIEGGAFKGAVLPPGFRIPKSKSLEIKKKAFEDIQLPFGHLWFNGQNAPAEKWFGIGLVNAQSRSKNFKFQGSVVQKIPNDLTYVPKFAYADQKSFPNEFRIASGVTTIKEGAFRRSTLPVGFILPSTVTEIEENAFLRTKIQTSFELNPQVRLHKNSFHRAILPNGFRIPKESTFVGGGNPFFEARLPIWSRWYNALNSQKRDKWFSNGRIELATKSAEKGDFKVRGSVVKDVNKDTEYIDYKEFENRAIGGSDFSIPNSVKYIGSRAFYKANLPSSIELPESVQIIGRAAFYNTIIENEYFKISENVREIRALAFARTTLPNGFVVPETVTTIHSTAFLDAKLEDGTKFRVPARAPREST